MWKRFSESGAVKAKVVVVVAERLVMNPEMGAKYAPELAEKPFVLGSI